MSRNAVSYTHLDLPNFAEVIWDYDIEAILADCQRLGVKEFTISSTFSSLFETIAKFEELGCTLDGIVTVSYTHLDVYKRQPVLSGFFPTLALLSHESGDTKPF